jgi:hypothetical protein
MRFKRVLGRRLRAGAAVKTRVRWQMSNLLAVRFGSTIFYYAVWERIATTIGCIGPSGHDLNSNRAAIKSPWTMQVVLNNTRS